MAEQPRPQVVLSGEQYDRQLLAAEMKELSKNPLDQTVPGGRYQGPDGSFHDAEGKLLSETASEPISETASESDSGGFNLETATRAELAAEAARRGITVTRGDGKEGEPLVDDFRAALK